MLNRCLRKIRTSLCKVIEQVTNCELELQTLKAYCMDKEIRKIEKGVKRSEKQLKHLEVEDKKRDKVVDKAKRLVRKKRKK